MNRLVVQGGQEWGTKLIHHRKIMQAEMRNNLKRLAFLAEERHVQYKNEFIEDRRKRIEANHAKMAAEKAHIKVAREQQKKSMFLIDMGFEKARQEQAAQKLERKRLAKLKQQKIREIQTKARREWLVEMNDKCMAWNKSPNEMQFAQYRLFDKTILNRLPRDRNLVLDRHDDIQEAVMEFEDGKKVDFEAQLATLKQQLKTEGVDVENINNVYDPNLKHDTPSFSKHFVRPPLTPKEKEEQDKQARLAALENGEELAAAEDELKVDEDNEDNENNEDDINEEDEFGAPINKKGTKVQAADETVIRNDVGEDVLTSSRKAKPIMDAIQLDKAADELTDAELAQLEKEFLQELQDLPTAGMINVLEQELQERFTVPRKEQEKDVASQLLSAKQTTILASKFDEIVNIKAQEDTVDEDLEHDEDHDEDQHEDEDHHNNNKN
ncbi:hypothetical protein SAMD00019534_032600 [Acytostelium subglobosum LB1]|uniref:hypothetical protein n=1 Tax=Acytostelium subglobosum LB1 TaxID=1410327 RepID=UPI000644C991|nr:hypothetical protein SAMD00019534_032600 [Acytostelium subglobosum LB1]GAM20085.1 hypothetical protein SAMD00019534_032600 [Acytostelium subglobosum LB1]|eukprot:XP_012756847.1 hypothetical protein SAMD00019534_032600 [Acytostelium subglobosum LB1]